MKCFCTACRTLLEDTELKTVYDWVPYGETNVPMASGQECPECGSDEIEDACQCERCGEWFGESEMYGSVCKVCAITGVTADLFFEFAEIWDETTGSYLDDFFCIKVLRMDPPQPDREFHNCIVRIWHSMKDAIPTADLIEYVVAYCRPDWLEFMKGR